MGTLPSLYGWVPVGAAVQDGTLMTDLCFVGDRRFSEPFFDDSITACMRLPFNAVFRHRLKIDTLEEWLLRHPGLSPSGFIFHMSRCGSTLLSQVLSVWPAHRVISEATPIDAALRSGRSLTSINEQMRISWLRAMVGMLAQPRGAEEREFFVKFDSWHSSLLPLILRAFPEVPWVFLVRNPLEVIVSHLRRPGAQMVPGMLSFGPPGLDEQLARLMPREEYCARVLGAICESAERVFEAATPNGLLIDYGRLPRAIEETVLPHFGIRPSAAERGAMAAVLRQDVKNPWLEFMPDSDAKRSEASVAMRAASERWVQPVYRRLLALAAAPASIRGKASKPVPASASRV